jgi:large subunit ribosomal protein L13
LSVKTEAKIGAKTDVVSSVPSSQVIVTDADGQIAGRLCSKVSKLLLEGNKVVIVNAEKALMSGSRKSILQEYQDWLQIASITHPKHGPFHPRRPDGLLARMVRGMLPRQKSKGIEARRRLRVYISVPTEFNKMKMTIFDDAKARKAMSYYLTMGEVASSMGWRANST